MPWRTDVDVRATLKARLGVNTAPYRILGACNPALGHRALDVDPDIGLLLPCNVVLREGDTGIVTVAFLDPEALMKLVDKPQARAVGREARVLLQRVCENLAVVVH